MTCKNFEEFYNQGLQAPTEDNRAECLALCIDTIARREMSDKYASIAIWYVNTHELYKDLKFESMQDFLKKQNYTLGTISHKIAYGNFCKEMGFSLEQLPSEYSVRSILTKNYSTNAKQIYLDACKKKLNKNNVSGKTATKEHNDEENASSDVDSVTQDVVSDAANESDMDDKLLLAHCPGIAEIKAALDDHKKAHSNHIFLDVIKESVPRDVEFTKGVLDKYKRKIRTVPILTCIVNEFTKIAPIPEELFTEINMFAQRLHQAEDKQLKQALNGAFSETDDSGEDIEDTEI